jgi:hypothetical protein
MEAARGFGATTGEGRASLVPGAGVSGFVAGVGAGVVVPASSGVEVPAAPSEALPASAEAGSAACATGAG